MLLGRKQISPSDRRNYAVDYDSWLDDGETVSTRAFVVTAGPATVPSSAIAGDGRSISFHVTGALLTTAEFEVEIQITTSNNQILNDHVVFNVVDA